MTKQTSNLDVTRLLQYLKSAEHSSTEEQWLREQLVSKELQRGLWALGRAVFPRQSRQQLCHAYATTLPHYAHLKAMGADAKAEYPQVKAHLDRCPRCSSECEELDRMVSAAYADEVPLAPSYPIFDLSFLEIKEKRSDSSSRPDDTPVLDWHKLWEDATSAGVRVHRFITEITLSLAAPFDRLRAGPFAQLAPPLRPALVAIPVPARRKQDTVAEGAETIKVLDLKYPPANLLIRIGRGPVVTQRMVLVVDVLRTEPPEPIPAARIALYDEQHRLMEQIGTDAAGNVRFEDVRVGRYFIQVRHAEDTWEFPLLVGDPRDEAFLFSAT